MKLSATNSINFKGYDAVPLKNLYMLNYSTPSQKDIMEDLQEIGKKEGFGVYLEQEDKLYDKLGYFQAGITQYKWSQDNKMIINNGSETEVLLPNNTSSKYNNLGQILGIHTKAAKTIFDGGNVFLGKKDDGENFLIIGETVLNATSANVRYEKPVIEDDFEKMLKELMSPISLKNSEFEIEIVNEGTGEKSFGTINYNSDEALNRIAKDFNVKKENICVLPQVDYHIDLFIRPIGYPYVLVNDIETAEELETSIFGDLIDGKAKEDKKIQTEKAIKALEEAGFIPIKVPGVFREKRCINFMNAIVNKHPDGTISYITGSSQNGRKKYEALEKEFDRILKSKIPNLRNIYHIGKKMSEKNPSCNQIMEDLFYRQGGLHCLVCEEPDFDKLA